MNDQKINILGSEWTIKEQSETENELLKNCDGYCDWTTKEIVIERELNGTISDMQQYPVQPSDENYESLPCATCSNNPKNGGSGLCYCILGQKVFY